MRAEKIDSQARLHAAYRILHDGIFPGFVVVEQIGLGCEINRLGYEPGRLSLYFCVARKDAPVDVYACSRGPFVNLPDTNPKISGAH